MSVAALLHLPSASARGTTPAIAVYPQFETRPSLIPQGATGDLRDLNWISYGGSVARAFGKGTVGVGQYEHLFRLKLEAFGLGKCLGHLVYERLRITPVAKPATAYTERLLCRPTAEFYQ